MLKPTDDGLPAITDDLAPPGLGVAPPELVDELCAAMAPRKSDIQTEIHAEPTMDSWKTMLQAYESKFQPLLGKRTPAFLQSCVLAVAENPYLLRCDRVSLIQSCIYTALCGLNLIPALGWAYLVPRKANKGDRLAKVRFTLGYKGMEHLAFRSGAVRAFATGVVYEGDAFDFELGTSAFVKHKPAFKHEDSIEHMLSAWAMAHLPGGEKAVGIASKERIEKARRMADPRSFAWPKFADSMARKTALRDLAKFLPVALELRYAIGVDEQEEIKALRDAAPPDAREAALAAVGP